MKVFLLTIVIALLACSEEELSILEDPTVEWVRNSPTGCLDRMMVTSFPFGAATISYADDCTSSARMEVFIAEVEADAEEIGIGSRKYLIVNTCVTSSDDLCHILDLTYECILRKRSSITELTCDGRGIWTGEVFTWRLLE